MIIFLDGQEQLGEGQNKSFKLQHNCIVVIAIVALSGWRRLGLKGYYVLCFVKYFVLQSTYLCNHAYVYYLRTMEKRFIVK